MIRHGFIFAIGVTVLSGCGSSSKSLGTEGTDSGVQPSMDAGGLDAAFDGAPPKVDRSAVTAVGDAPLDFSDPAAWLCLPGTSPNECLVDLDATEFLKDGSKRLDRHVPAKDPPFDCFYVYPTVDLSGDGNMTDFSDANVDLILDPLLSQAARFTRICKVYAPLYRQVSLSLTAPAAGTAEGDAAASGGEAGVGFTGNSALAYADVEAAFQYYLAHYNNGRKFVLMGHSQGTFVLTTLMQNLFDNDPTMRSNMISALLIGGAIDVPVGKAVGGTFANVPICTTQGQVGCIVAYNSFAKDAPPPPDSLFGTAAAGQQDACTNPALLAGNSGNFAGSYSPTKFYDVGLAPNEPATTLPHVNTPFTMASDLFAGTCVTSGKYTFLQVYPNQSAGDERAIPAYRNTPSEALGFGTHLADYNLELDDLIATVSAQAAAALK